MFHPARRSLCFLFGLVSSMAWAGGPYCPVDPVELDSTLHLDFKTGYNEPARGENTRAVASGLAVFLGPFGAHRLYLGTTPKVAVVYGVTFGGFGLLALIDLAHLLFTKDLTPYRNNRRVFMWNANQPEVTPP